MKHGVLLWALLFNQRAFANPDNSWRDPDGGGAEIGIGGVLLLVLYFAISHYKGEDAAIKTVGALFGLALLIGILRRFVL